MTLAEGRREAQKEEKRKMIKEWRRWEDRREERSRVEGKRRGRGEEGLPRVETKIDY